MNNNEKHAYLIMAHKFDYTFETLLKLLDDYHNDIFIHMDIKNKDFDEISIRNIITKSNVFFTKRTSVTWGSYSVTNATLLLLKKAVSTKKYLYYHLISGQDLPIKTQNYIHNFFKKNEGKEFIRYEDKLFKYKERVKYYYPLQELIGNYNNLFKKIYRNFFLALQKVFRVNRNKDMEYQKGTNWFSITDSLARYVIKKEKFIKKIFKNTYCSDELFLQTIVLNSEFINNLYHKDFDNNQISIMRLIDWKRGNPYIFKDADFDEINESEMLFARKFDCMVDKTIINKIYQKVNNGCD